MIGRYLAALRLGLIVVDFVAATFVFLAASLIRYGDGDWVTIWAQIGVDIRLAAMVFGLLWVSALWFEGLYRVRARLRLVTELTDILQATLIVAALTLSSLYVLRAENVSRVFLIILFVAEPIVTFASRAILRAAFARARTRGYSVRHMLIVGDGRLAQDFADRMESQAAFGVRIVGHLAVPGDHGVRVTRPVVGTADDIGAIFHGRIVDEVAVCLPAASAHYAEPVARIAADEGKTVRIVSYPLDAPPANVTEEEFEGFVVRSLIHDGQREVGLAAKRILDLVGSVIGLVVLGPFMIVVSVIIRLREGGPVLFRQTRVGLHGRPFTIYKFRTMVPDAEERYEEVARLSDTKGAAFKMADDPRITPLGHFLRKTSIDELPQLLNVLKGEMSLVGPRPAPPREVADYDIWHRRRLSMKPGITGLWQVGSRFDEHFDERAQADLTYIDTWSFWLDLEIIMRTVPALLRRGGH